MEAVQFLARYSDNEDYDKHGRWARTAYYKMYQIGWISRNPHPNNGGNVYSVKTNFPVHSHSDIPFGIEVFDNYEDAKTYIRINWQHFTKLISQ